MWSKIGFILFVGVVAATNMGWLPDTEYTYTVRSRSLTSLSIDDTYSGVFYKGKLTIRTGKWETLQQRISAKIHGVQISRHHNISLPEGWESDVDYSEGSETLKLSNEPIHIFMKDNTISGIAVTSKMPKWEANLIRGIVSQLQIQVDPRAGCTYSVMEETVTGEYNTVYEHCGGPQYAQDSKESTIIITKTKNFEKSAHHPSLHYGFGDLQSMGLIQPNSNQMGRFYSRSSVSRVAIMGVIHRFNVSTSETVNEVSVSPTLNSAKRALVGSKVNVTLEKRITGKTEYPAPHDPITISLVYEQDSPFEKDNTVSEQQQFHTSRQGASPLSEQKIGHLVDYLKRQPRPHLDKAPFIPFIGEFVASEGKSINDKLDIPVEVTKLSKQIANELQDAEAIPSHQTLSKYLILTRVASIMSQEQMQHVGDQLYTKQHQGIERAAWQVYRDGIAESGTLPAFSVIKNWILERKLEGREAAQVVSTIAESVMTPTEEFTRSFIEFTQNPQLLKQRYVNDSAILACSNMMRRVYVNYNSSALQYPVYTFENFRTEKGLKMITVEYVPYVTEQLNKAIDAEDNHRMNVYIRALGNVGHKSIIGSLDVFWSQDKAPLFQRVLSILALDKVVKMYPAVAIEALFRIYNSAQLPQQMRVIAVYQIIRASPSKTILQQMARQTNIDYHEYVNAAVQSAIREAANLKAPQYKELAENAESALHLLTDKDFGYQYSKAYFRDYIERELIYLKSIRSVGSMDSYIPQTIRAKFTAILGGLEQDIFEVESVTSSVADLLNLFQLRHVKDDKQESRAHLNGFDIADAESEQLQGVIRYRFGGIETLLSFDNESIISTIRDFEHELKNKEFQMLKLVNRDNLFLAAPLESGVFYVYSLDAPTFVSLKGKVNFEAHPSISNGKQIQNVKRVNFKTEANMVISRKIESRLSIVTVYDHHEYSSGFDKNWQVNLPLKVSVRGDLEKNQYESEVEPIKHENFEFFHYSTWPVLGHRNLFDLRPISNKPDTHVIVASPLYRHDKTYLKQTGFSIRLNSTSEHPITWAKLYKKMQKRGIVGLFMSLFHSAEVDHTQISLSYSGKESVARKIRFETGRRDVNNRDIQQIQENTGEQNDIENLASATVYYANIKMEGDKQSVHYHSLAGFIENSVKLNKQMYVSFVKQPDQPNQHIKPYQAFAWTSVQFQNLPQIMFKQVLEMDVKASGRYYVSAGETGDSKLQGEIRFRRSEERKDYLKKQEGTSSCLNSKFTSLQPNRQISPCDNLTDAAGLFDQYDVQVKHENSKYVLELFDAAYEIMLRTVGGQSISIPIFRKEFKQIQSRFAPDFTTVNITALTDNGQSSDNFIPVGEWTQRIVAVHPTYDIETRLVGKYLESKTFEPICVVNSEQIKTFDDYTYTHNMNENDWYVVVFYNQTFAKSPEADQRITYAMMTRKSKQAKELKLKIVHPKTRGEEVTVELIPVGTQKPTIKINGQQSPWNQTRAGEFYDRLIRFYGRSDSEIKVEIDEYLYIVYNAQTTRISAKSDILRGDLRGLCGNFDGNKHSDEALPQNCQSRSTHEFVKSYRYPIEETNLQQRQCSHESKPVSDVLTGLKLKDESEAGTPTGVHQDSRITRFSRYGQ